jgi:DNA-binding response OmpR family regulator
MRGALSGKRVLVVEDEYFIATDLQRLLENAGAEVVGPAADLAAALALVQARLDAAVLDVNLDGVLCYPLAERLSEAAVPYVFVTGDDSWALPAAFQDRPRIAKPFAAASVVALVEDLCALPHS